MCSTLRLSPGTFCFINVNYSALLGLEFAQNIDLSKVEGVSAPRTGPARNALLEDPKTVYNRPAILASVADMARNSRLFARQR